MVANTAERSCGGKCLNIPIVVDGFASSTDFFILPLRGCYVVLGAHWLRDLGPVTFKFNDLWLKFKHQGRHHVLQGIKSKPTSGLSSQCIDKALRRGDEGLVLQLNNVIVTTENATLVPKLK